MKTSFYFIFFIIFSINAIAQNDLLEGLEMDATEEPDFTTGTFKSTRVINSHSIETLGKKQLDFRISHRFGRINSGAYNLWGLDQSTIRLAFEYGVLDWLNIGVGRSSFNKTYDGYLKIKLLRQTGNKSGSMPVSVSLFSNVGIYTTKTSDPYINDNVSGRMSYVHQILIARKFNEHLSLQIAPTLVHRNYVFLPVEHNNTYAIQAGGRVKISKRVSVNLDYIYRLNKAIDLYYNSLSFGVDIETGGHVFQLHVTNSQGMIEQYFIAQTDGAWQRGDIYYGFNISRQFNLQRKKKTN